MVKTIVELIRDLSRQHKLVWSFTYDQPSRSLGIGNEKMIHIFLEDPISISVASPISGNGKAIVNFNVLATPQKWDNIPIERKSEEFLQSLCMDVSLNFVAKIRDMYNNGESMVELLDFSFLTLRHYYDNDCVGVRVTLECNVRNPIYFCDLENHFDEEKEFDASSLLPTIDTENPSSCKEEYSYKLPKIKF